MTSIARFGTSLFLWDMAQDPHRDAVYIATDQDPIAVFDPPTGTVRTFAPAIGSRSITVDRAPAANGAIVTAGVGGALRRFDRNGVDLGVLATIPNPYAVEFDRCRSIAAELRTAPNDRDVRVSFPDQPGRAYAVLFGVSGFAPGVPLPDGRHLPLNPDPLVQRTLAGPLPPLLRNTVGVLDASGGATARFDANVFGAAVSGVRVWAVAVTFDPAAPLGIGRISAPLLFVL